EILPPPPPLPPEVKAIFAKLPPGQRRVAEALIDGDEYGRTYREVAELLQLSGGTVRRHLARIRANHPTIYAGLMKIRAGQLAERHARAVMIEEIIYRGGAAYLDLFMPDEVSQK